MPKIELSLDELIEITTCMEVYAQEVQTIDRLEWHRLMSLCSKLHERYAAAETQERFEERCRQYGLLPDDKIPDSIYAPDPEDFKGVP